MEYITKSQHITSLLVKEQDLHNVPDILNCMETLLDDPSWVRHYNVLRMGVLSSVCSFMRRLDNHYMCPGLGETTLNKYLIRDQVLVIDILNKCEDLLFRFGERGTSPSSYLDPNLFSGPPCGAMCIKNYPFARSTARQMLKLCHPAPRVAAIIADYRING